MPRLTPLGVCWLSILVIALVLRLAAGVWWQSRLPPGEQFQFSDSVSYWSLASAVARGDPYEYVSADQRVFRTPGYPVLLAGLFRAYGGEPPVMVARALSAALGTLTVALVGWWATLLFDARAGCFAGAITAVYPGAVATGVFVLSEAPFCPLMILQLSLWTLACREPSLSKSLPLAVGAGAAAALAILMRPSWLLFTPLAIVAAVAIDRAHKRQVLIGLAMFAALAVVMSPWWIRNARLVGHFVPTTLQVGASLYDGLSPTAEGGSEMGFVAEFTELEKQQPSGDVNDPFEYRLDRRMWNAAVSWARENPARVCELAGIKFVRIWNVWPNEPAFRGWLPRLAVLVTYVPLLVLGLVGVFRFTRRGWPYVLAWLPAVYFTLLHVVFVGSMRYREPAMLALTVLAAGVLVGGHATWQSAASSPSRSAVD